MNDRFFLNGVWCAVAGFILSQVAPAIAHSPGREPMWAVPILFGLVLGWVGFTAAALLSKKRY